VKAWSYECIYPFRDEWFASLGQTPYRDWRPHSAYLTDQAGKLGKRVKHGMPLRRPPASRWYRLPGSGRHDNRQRAVRLVAPLHRDRLAALGLDRRARDHPVVAPDRCSYVCQWLG
jgi:hypothetical protein